MTPKSQAEIAAEEYAQHERSGLVDPGKYYAFVAGVEWQKTLKISPIEDLVKELENDKGYRQTWVLNIAMSFQDACTQEGIKFPQLHEVSNKAAEHFLRLLCMVSQIKELETKLDEAGRK